MRGITKLIALVASLSVLAPAQDKDEAEPANAPKEPTAEEISARESGIATAWKNALGGERGPAGAAIELEMRAP